MKPSLIFSIWLDTAFQRLQICQKIAVRQNHAARLGGRPRSEKNLRDVIACDRFVRKVFVQSMARLTSRQRGSHDTFMFLCVGQILQYEPRDGVVERRLFARRIDQFNARISCHAPGKIERGAIVHWHSHYSAQQTAPKRRGPFRAVRPPNQYPLARPHASPLQFQRTRRRYSREFRVTPSLPPIAAPLHKSNIAAIALELSEQS